MRRASSPSSSRGRRRGAFVTLQLCAAEAAAPLGPARNRPPNSGLRQWSVLGVLSSAERRDGRSLGEVSWHRPANRTLLASLGPQAIPRRIVQTGLSFAGSLVKNGEWMRPWWQLNPEYDYSFFGDAHAARFVRAHGTRRERAAYASILTGSQRADLFRVIYLHVAGGVYADVDEGLRRPLRSLVGGRDAAGGAVPASASAVAGSFWPFEFLLYAPRHPIMNATARFMSEAILRELSYQRAGDTKRQCRSPHSCVIRNTGPLAYTSSVGDATKVLGGCKNSARLLRPTFLGGWLARHECAASPDPLLRATHVCSADKGTVWNHWSCGAARHWDCRNSERRRRCHKGHYATVAMKDSRAFFNLSAQSLV